MSNDRRHRFDHDDVSGVSDRREDRRPFWWL